MCVDREVPGNQVVARSGGFFSRRKPLVRWARRVIALGLLVAGFVAAYVRRTEIHQAFDRIDRPDWVWLVCACVAQAASMAAFARLQRWLLRCGGVEVQFRDMVEITLAGNALSTSLPGGAAWAAGWIWGQLRRRQVDRVLAGWVVLVAGALASFALFLWVVTGAFVAGPDGPAASLRWVGAGLLGVGALGAGVIVAVVRSNRSSRWWAQTVAAANQRGGDNSGGRHSLIRAVDRFAQRVRVVTPGPLAWAEALAVALYNWFADLATLVFVIRAVHLQIPWRGVIIAYALTQIAASVPITPGGLAVVEGSLTALLVAYGMPTADAITVVLLYRLVSFWALVPIGWGAWAYLEVAQRRNSTRPHHRQTRPDVSRLGRT
jgi:hypothetical protein